MFFKKLSISLVISISLIFSMTNVYAQKVYLGGNSIGIKLNYDGVLITGTYDITVNNKRLNPKNYGFKEGLMITKVNGIRIYNINELMKEIEKNTKLSKRILLTLLENNYSCNKELHLQNFNNKFSTGLYVCDGITGIGTMTYYNPSTNRFGALGHIMNSSRLSVDTNYIRGNIYSSKITSVIKSKPGYPGEKIAEISTVKIGDISLNNHFGIFGNYIDEELRNKQLIETSKINEIKKGKAYFYTVIQDEVIEEFEIEIIGLKNQKKSDVKGITFRITDSRIIDCANGIVQGMSGSPIIQNGKLIGCITHVDLNNPCIGYGLYIDWMLENDN